ncbi:MAG: acyl carrier protein [Flavobacteriales bacterium]|nr:acyl carrier protein [Flavobacteriales bacterium]
MPESSEQFLKVFSSLFQDAGDIDQNTLFRELEEWSSMQALIVIAAIDEHFGVTIPEREFREAKTVGDLYQLTKNG